MAEYYHTLLENGGRLLKDGEVVHETDYQILGHKNNEAQTPPEKKMDRMEEDTGLSASDFCPYA